MAPSISIQKIPRWAWFAGGAVVLILLIALIVPAFLDVDRYRPQIVAALEKETGRKVTIDKISARLLPSPAVVVSGIRIGNPSGFPEGHLADVKAIYASLAFSPLLGGNVEITSLEVSRPHVTLLTDSRGRINYDFSKPSPVSKDASSPSPDSRFELRNIGSFTISNAEVATGSVTGPSSPIVPAMRLTGLTLNLSNLSFEKDSMKKIQGSADLSSVKVDLSDGNPPLEFRSGTVNLANGSANGDFRLPYGKVADLTGKLTIPDLSNPVVTFEVSTPLLDLDALPPAKPASGARGSSTPTTSPSELIAQGKIAAEKIRISGYEAFNSNAAVKVFTDRVEISPLTLSVYGGTLSITARLNRRTSPETFTSNITLHNLKLEQFLAASPNTRGKMTGTAALTLSLSGSLAPKLEQTLSGPGKFEISDGRFPGLNLGETLGALNKLQQVMNLGSSNASGGNETTYRSIAGDIHFGGGRVSSNLIRIDSSVGLIEISGNSGFDNTLNYRGRATLSSSAATSAPGVGDLVTGILGAATKQNVGQVSVPFTLAGTFDKPQFRPGGGLPGLQTSQPGSDASQSQPKKTSIMDFLKRP